MNSPNPYSEDELDRLMRGTLNARVGAQEPPRRVWKRIKRELETDKSPPRRFRTRWSPLVIQSALALLLAVLGGVGLQTRLSPDETPISTRDLLTSVATVYVEERSASPALAMLNDKTDLRLLKTLSKPSPTCTWQCGTSPSQTDAEPASQPPLMVPRDAPPNASSPEGRALKAELSWPTEVEDQNLLHSGPYPWFK